MYVCAPAELFILLKVAPHYITAVYSSGNKQQYNTNLIDNITNKAENWKHKVKAEKLTTEV